MRYRILAVLLYAVCTLAVGLILLFATTGCTSRSRLCLGDCGYDYHAENIKKLTARANAVVARQTKIEQVKREDPERYFYFQGLRRALKYAVKEYDHNWRTRKARQAEMDSGTGVTDPNNVNERE